MKLETLLIFSNLTFHYKFRTPLTGKKACKRTQVFWLPILSTIEKKYIINYFDYK